PTERLAVRHTCHHRAHPFLGGRPPLLEAALLGRRWLRTSQRWPATAFDLGRQLSHLRRIEKLTRWLRLRILRVLLRRHAQTTGSFPLAPAGPLHAAAALLGTRL